MHPLLTHDDLRSDDGAYRTSPVEVPRWWSFVTAPWPTGLELTPTATPRHYAITFRGQPRHPDHHTAPRYAHPTADYWWAFDKTLHDASATALEEDAPAFPTPRPSPDDPPRTQPSRYDAARLVLLRDPDVPQAPPHTFGQTPWRWHRLETDEDAPAAAQLTLELSARPHYRAVNPEASSYDHRYYPTLAAEALATASLRLLTYCALVGPELLPLYTRDITRAHRAPHGVRLSTTEPLAYVQIARAARHDFR